MTYAASLDQWQDIRYHKDVKPMRIASTQTPCKMGFTFNLYGEKFAEVFMSTMGFLSPRLQSPTFAYTIKEMPDTKIYLSSVIAGLWSPLLPRD